MQLENSREAVDAANIRAAYAEVMSAGITGDTSNQTKTVTLKQTKSGWQSSFEFPANLTPTNDAAVPTGNAGQSVTVSYDATNGGATVTLKLVKE